MKPVPLKYAGSHRYDDAEGYYLWGYNGYDLYGNYDSLADEAEYAKSLFIHDMIMQHKRKHRLTQPSSL